MSIQGIFNQEVFNYFPKIVEILKTVEFFERNQIRCKVWQECLNSRVAICNMKENELKEFEDELIAIFKYNNWI